MLGLTHETMRLFLQLNNFVGILPSPVSSSSGHTSLAYSFAYPFRLIFKVGVLFVCRKTNALTDARQTTSNAEKTQTSEET